MTRCNGPTVYLDIETVPDDEYLPQALAPDATEETRRTLSTDPLTCRILVVGAAFGDHTPATTIAANRREDEPRLLEKLGDVLARTSRIVTWRGSFDLNVWRTRMILHGLPWPSTLRPEEVASWFVRYRNAGKHIDLRAWCTNWERSPHTLDDWARRMGVGGKLSGMTGADVLPAWQAGRLDEIRAYCQQDVELTRLLAHKLTPYFPETR
jgi:predicted PolB exonuclease-like 3'-5' exonuclease